MPWLDSKPVASLAESVHSGAHDWRLCCRAVLTIQSYRRMLPVRRQYLRQRSAAIALQAGERGRRARKDCKELKRRHYAAIKVQVRRPSSYLPEISASFLESMSSVPRGLSLSSSCSVLDTASVLLAASCGNCSEKWWASLQMLSPVLLAGRGAWAPAAHGLHARHGGGADHPDWPAALAAQPPRLCAHNRAALPRGARRGCGRCRGRAGGRCQRCCGGETAQREGQLCSYQGMDISRLRCLDMNLHRQALNCYLRDSPSI